MNYWLKGYFPIISILFREQEFTPSLQISSPKVLHCNLYLSMDNVHLCQERGDNHWSETYCLTESKYLIGKQIVFIMGETLSNSPCPSSVDNRPLDFSQICPGEHWFIQKCNRRNFIAGTVSHRLQHGEFRWHCNKDMWTFTPGNQQLG